MELASYAVLRSVKSRGNPRFRLAVVERIELTPVFAKTLGQSAGEDWRRGWDSNPRVRSDKTLSRRPRYDHFGTSPVGVSRSSGLSIISLRVAPWHLSTL